MSAEWKPGDVAMVKAHIGPRETRVARGGLGRWRGEDGSYVRVNGVRPLVVIDPEDREQVERFVSTYFGEWEKSSDARRVALPGEVMPLRSHIDAAQAALREFANPKPPKPEEPIGLGAVVEDEDGSLLIRNAPTGDRPWVTMHGATFSWDDIDLVRVLSEGVQP